MTKKKSNKKNKTISNVQNKQVKNDVKIVITKREEYIEQWKTMYELDKKKWSNKMFDGINPMLNKTPLSTEADNFCTVAYDQTKKGPSYPDGMPIGIFSMVVTKRGTNIKPIGKQYIVDPVYQKKGIGTAMMLLLQKELLDTGYDWFYIGCSSMSSAIMKKLGYAPYVSDEEHDMFKFKAILDKNIVESLLNEHIFGKFDVAHREGC